jgi:hypothetical protein
MFILTVRGYIYTGAQTNVREEMVRPPLSLSLQHSASVGEGHVSVEKLCSLYNDNQATHN